ncbi:hypothetical protein [Niallia taxi]|uniref:hypothetical protein n=1 Tax=Niallia taxi TaxID=2499688 RepID=UPI00254CB0A1|nr:hypothetical protein [Niallia taxi]MDK8643452.1 hypothetical protein [Niallia taxi]
MNSNEEFVKDKIQASYNSVQIVEGEDPPDYYVITNTKKILLEVTNIEDIYYDGVKIHNRITMEYGVGKICRDLNNLYSGKLSNNDSIMLYFQGPFFSTKKLENKLRIILKEITEQDQYPEEEKHEIEGGYVTIYRRGYIKDKIFGITGVITNEYTADIEYLAKLAISERILSKVDKMKKVPEDFYNGEMWLGLLNHSVLASNDTYIRVLKSLEIQHDFKKIIIVDTKGNISEVEV